MTLLVQMACPDKSTGMSRSTLHQEERVPDRVPQVGEPMLTIDEFESAWGDLFEKYKLQSHP
jgi:hypothetical protein